MCLQVKGSPYPRSYYKCSQAGCPAKKIIERDPKSGRISQAELKASWQPLGGAAAAGGAPGRLRCAWGRWRCASRTPRCRLSLPGTASAPAPCCRMQNDHNHPKPGHVRGQPSFAGGLYRPPSSARHRQRRLDEEDDTEEEEEEEQQQQQPAEEDGGEEGEAAEGDEMQQEDAVAALATMKYSPVVPGMLGAAPHDTPASLLPIPASLRASEDPEDPAANGWAVQPASAALHRLQRSSGPGAAGAGGSSGAGDDSDLSGWRFCGVCGMRLDASWPLATWHMQQHLQAQRAAGALAAHARHFSTLGRRPAAAGSLGRSRTAARRSPGLCKLSHPPFRGIP